MQSISRTQLIIVFILVLLVVGLVVFGGRGHEVSVETGRVATVLEWPSTEVKQETITEQDTGYQITATYPETQSTAVTSYFTSFINEQITSFKQDVVASQPAPDPESVARTVTLDISYRQEKYARADNYVFMVAIDTGGAHAFTTTRTFSFSQNGTLISLERLFASGVKGLETITPYVRTVLSEELGGESDWIREGTMPVADLFECFVVTDEGVTFIFDPYQVAPYAAGIQTVAVPYAVFEAVAGDVF